MQIIGEALWDALMDTLKIVVVLYLSYLIIGYLTHHRAKGYAKLFNKSTKAGPLIGAFLGCVPQCGFSSVMADVYSKKGISLGTLIAVFIATSDEAIPIMLGHTDFYIDMLILIGFKVGFAIIFGDLVDLVYNLIFYKSKKKLSVNAEDLIKKADEDQNPCACGCHGGEREEKRDEDECDCGCCADNIFLDALIHTINISIFIFIATAIINLLISFVGLDFITGWLGDNVYLQILLCSLIGFIPNCAGSVFLVEMYLNGGIAFCSMLAGLSVGSGIGLFVLFSKNKGKKKILENLMIMGLLYVFGVVSGIIVNFIY